MQDLEVVVVGGGIGGLTTALALQRTGQRVTVLERTQRLRPAGAGISLWSNGVKVLDALGLGPGIAAVGGDMRRMRYRDRDGVELCEFSLEPLVDRVGERPYPVRRSDLQDLLLGAVGDVVELGVACTDVVQRGDRVCVAAEDGRTFEGDLVVVADGTNSRLRHVVAGAVERHYVGYHNWNGLVPAEIALGEVDSWTLHVGEGKRVSTMPVRDGHYFFFDVPLDDPVPDPTDPQGTLRHHFAGWDDRVQRLLDGIDPATVTNVAIHTHEPIGRYAEGRVALIGDAAHTTAPDLGQGGCLAMEDALVLSQHLATTSVGVADALTRYSTERVPRATEIMARATKRARLSHAHDPLRTVDWYRELADEDGTRIIAGICESILGGPLR